MKNFVRLIILALVSLLLTNCDRRVQPIHNPTDIPMPKALVNAPLDKIANAIKVGGQLANWKMTAVSPGEITGVLHIRSHEATVKISYSPLTYSIVYVSSVNLLDKGTGIHRNYNMWVSELQDSMDIQLGKLARQIAEEPHVQGEEESAARWRELRNSRDLAALLNFSVQNQDNAYGALARKRLNLLMSRGSDMTYDPTGKWRVIVAYRRGDNNTSACPWDSRWNFELNLQRGRFSKNVWSSGDVLYVAGENSDDRNAITFTIGKYSSTWDWDKKLTLNKDEKNFTGRTIGSCPGTLDIHMRKLG